MSVCRSCGAEILWARTERGKKMPLDAAPVCDAIAETRGLFVLRETDHQDGPLAIAAWGLEGTEPHYRSHFASCPSADQHRKLATGGLVPGPREVVIGDKGPETVDVRRGGHMSAVSRARSVEPNDMEVTV